jgi:hypothetical protein
MPLESLSEAWQAAELELGIRVTAPALVPGSNGENIECAALVADFGSSEGMAAFPLSRQSSVSESLSAVNQSAVSFLDDDSYSKFDRDLFIATLNDWGWFGTGDPPSWYTGAPWST